MLFRGPCQRIMVNCLNFLFMEVINWNSCHPFKDCGLVIISFLTGTLLYGTSLLLMSDVLKIDKV